MFLCKVFLVAIHDSLEQEWLVVMAREGTGDGRKETANRPSKAEEPKKVQESRKHEPMAHFFRTPLAGWLSI